VIAKSLTRWALRMALIWAVKKGIDMATQPRRSPRPAARVQGLH
jgi:hypothetical protein